MKSAVGQAQQFVFPLGRRNSATLRFLKWALLSTTLVLPGVALAQAAGVDEKAQKLLKVSTDFLASQKQFTVETRSSLEVVLVSGQKIQFDNTARQSIQRPNKLRAERVGGLLDQVVYYDGKSITLHNPSEHRYATVAAPATLEEMLDFARESLDIVAPAADLIYKNAFDILMEDVTSGFVVGKGVVEGVRCDHLAFRSPHVDWQIWIQEGGPPLPRKLVITTRDVASAPQFSVVATKWNFQPKFTAQTFTFAQPKGVKRVEFVPLAKR